MAHAILSPSSASRWLTCTPSARLEALMPDTTSAYAEEGTKAHDLAARMLYDDPRYEQLFNEAPADMAEAVQVYVDTVRAKYAAAERRNKDAILLIEERLDLTDYVPDGFGTADAVVIADGTMEVIDYKHGKGVRVDAFKNKQMMLYALGALAQMALLYDIHTVRMTIVQPRMDNISEYEMTAEELQAWGSTVLAKQARAAYDGEGTLVPGPHCTFCKAKASCKALAEAGRDVLNRKSPDLLTPREVAELLPLLTVIKNWLEAFAEGALNAAMAGTEIPGYKVVEGRSVRQYADEAAITSRLLGEGYEVEAILKPRTLRGITELEKLVGKKLFGSLTEGLIDKPAGKPTLVPVSDSRAPYNRAATDFADI